MNEFNRTIGSFNMSWAADRGEETGSEKHFIHDGLKRNKRFIRDKRILWKNSLKLIQQFWLFGDCIGLQEMENNVLAKELGKNVGGINTILKKLGGENINIKKNINIPVYGYIKHETSFCYLSTQHEFGYPSILTVWKTTRFGYPVAAYGDDFETIRYGKPIPKGTLRKNISFKTAGRPITVVLTNVGFILINLHAPNDPEDSLNNMTKFRSELNTVYYQALDYFRIKDITAFNKINPARILIMGDFNDPHHGIGKIYSLYLNNIKLTDGSGSNGLKSCCYNFNSSCKDSEFNNSYVTVSDSRGKAKPWECFVKESEAKGTMSIDYAYPGRGEIKNYRFTGDYCLGLNPLGPLSIFRPNPKPTSSESDHEFVFNSFRIK